MNRRNRTLQLENLEDRLTPVMAFSLNVNALTITGDSASDTLTLFTSISGNLQHNQSGVGGLASADDLDPLTVGTQSRLVSALTGCTITLGAGSDSVTITSVATGVSIVNVEVLNVALSSVEADASLLLTDNALTVNNVPMAYMYGLTSSTMKSLTGGSAQNTLDATAWTGGGMTLNGGAGNDIIKGGAGADMLMGGDGDDQFFSRDSAADTLLGGNGFDTASFDSYDAPSSCDSWNPLPAANDNRSQKIKVLAVNYDPLVPSQGNKHLYEVFNWPKPQQLAEGYEESLERASGGAVTFEIVEWRNVNEIPRLENGYQYTADEYYQNRLTNTNWQTGTGATVDVRKVLKDQAITPMIDAGIVDEVWFFSDHYMLVGGEAFMAGPGAFFINGPVYSDVAVSRPFACYGFSYERGVAEMLHNTAHRVENHGNRTWGSWNLANPTSNWDKFSANVTQSNGVAGVGTCHYPPNALSDYDYSNATVVQSWADDFLDYPEFTGTTRDVSRDTWRLNSGTSSDDQKSYLEWYYHHMPRGAGVNADGRQNNWYKYIYDYANYTVAGQPLPLRATMQASDLFNLGGTDHTFRIALSSPAHVKVSTFDSTDALVTGPNGFNQLAQLVSVSDTTDGPYRVATYTVTAPGGTWDASERGTYTVMLQAGQVGDNSGSTLPQQVLGSFQLRTTAAQLLSNDADTSLLLRFDGNLTGIAGETPSASLGVAYTAGLQNQAFHPANPGWVRYPTSGNIVPTAGTVEFWIQPDWNATDNGNKTFFNVGTPFNRSIMFQFDDWADWLKMMVWGDDPSTTGVTETNWERNFHFQIPSWTAGQWHHVAVTWDNATRTMAMFADGVQVQSRNDMPILNGFSTNYLSIGSQVDYNESGQSAYDEFRISTRARTAGEIAADYQAGLATTGLAIDATNLALNQWDSQRLTATATATFGGSRNVSTQVAWFSSNPTVATVAPDGVLKAIAAGTATITATFDTLTATCNLTVTDASRPTAVLAPVSDLTTESTTPIDFTITYSDNAQLNVANLESRDVRVHSRNGISRHATFVSVTPSGNGSPRTATYQLTPPNGNWDERDNGLYTVESTAWQVGDTGGQWVPAGVLGTFRVRISVPQISTVQVNDGSAQRSRVKSLRLPFNELVTFDSSSFLLTGPAGTVPMSIDNSASTLTQTIVILTPTGPGIIGGSLPDGLYSLTLFASQVTDSFSQALDGDGDGIPGGDFDFDFHRLFGDLDGNRTVDGSDFSAFGAAFGYTGFDSAFDYDDSSTVDGSDFGEFGNRFGVTL